MVSKKTEKILNKCSEIYTNLECKGDQEQANTQIAELLEIVSKGTVCEKHIKEVLKMYWEMKENSQEEYRYIL